MTHEHFPYWRRRLSINYADAMLLIKALEGPNVSNDALAAELAERISTIVSEESDRVYRAKVDAYRNAVVTSQGELEVDDDAEVSFGDEAGAYVMTWSWVYAEDTNLPEEYFPDVSGG